MLSFPNSLWGHLGEKSFMTTWLGEDAPCSQAWSSWWMKLISCLRLLAPCTWFRRPHLVELKTGDPVSLCWSLSSPLLSLVKQIPWPPCDLLLWEVHPKPGLWLLLHLTTPGPVGRTDIRLSTKHLVSHSFPTSPWLCLVIMLIKEYFITCLALQW
jgi:hypothetical protein